VKYAVVIPVADDCETVRSTLSRVFSACCNFVAKDSSRTLSIYAVVDEKTPINTVLYLCEERDNKTLVLVKSSGGLANAYRCGLATAARDGAERIVEMDIGHPPELLPILFSQLDYYPVVYCTRRACGGRTLGAPWYRRVLSWANNWLGRVYLGILASDVSSGYEGFRSGTVKALLLCDLKSRSYDYQMEVKAYLRDLPFIEVPLTYEYANSHLKFRHVWESICRLISLRGCLSVSTRKVI
jgi:dolichol-phosphate mannosyltransferase